MVPSTPESDYSGLMLTISMTRGGSPSLSSMSVGPGWDPPWVAFATFTGSAMEDMGLRGSDTASDSEESGWQRVVRRRVSPAAGAADAERWHRVYEYAPWRTPWGKSGWRRLELEDLSAVQLCRTDAPWCSTRHSQAVVFRRLQDVCMHAPAAPSALQAASCASQNPFVS